MGCVLEDVWGWFPHTYLPGLNSTRTWRHRLSSNYRDRVLQHKWLPSRLRGRIWWMVRLLTRLWWWDKDAAFPGPDPTGKWWQCVSTSHQDRVLQHARLPGQLRRILWRMGRLLTRLWRWKPVAPLCGHDLATKWRRRVSSDGPKPILQQPRLPTTTRLLSC